MIVASGELLLAIVNDVLDYAKLETDHVELNVVPSNLQEMLQSILYSIEMTAKHRGQSIKVTFDPTLPVTVKTDIRRIQQSKFPSRNRDNPVTRVVRCGILIQYSALNRSLVQLTW
jgi:hypothetical protein